MTTAITRRQACLAAVASALLPASRTALGDWQAYADRLIGRE
ncbi:hypothetical protein [Variovorax sp. Varisp62]